MPLKGVFGLVKVILGVFVKEFCDIDCDRKTGVVLYPQGYGVIWIEY